jgi:hypothetical protein
LHIYNTASRLINPHPVNVLVGVSEDHERVSASIGSSFISMVRSNERQSGDAHEKVTAQRFAFKNAKDMFEAFIWIMTFPLPRNPFDVFGCSHFSFGVVRAFWIDQPDSNLQRTIDRPPPRAKPHFDIGLVAPLEVSLLTLLVLYMFSERVVHSQLDLQ